MSGSTCKSCVHWDQSPDGVFGPTIGTCQRHPPLISETLLSRSLRNASDGEGEPKALTVEWALYEASAFPTTHWGSRCGEHEDRMGGMPC